MKNDGYILGIDPDVEKSGFAMLNCATRKFEYAGALSMPDSVKYLDWVASELGGKVVVVIEDSDQSTNYHYCRTDRQPIVFAKGRSVGMCHATLRHLHEIAESYGLHCVMMRPLRKSWKGANGKITQEEITQFIDSLPNRCNQEVRDCALLAWCFADYPIRIKVINRI